MLFDNLKSLIVPKIDELTVQNIIEFATKHVDLFNYLPESNKGITLNHNGYETLVIFDILTVEL